jgi:hypothetical protein
MIMNAIKVDTTVDQALADAVPELRPLIGKRIELIALQAESPAESPRRKKITFDEFLEHRIVAPPGTPPLTDADIERAIIEGALDGNV